MPKKNHSWVNSRYFCKKCNEYCSLLFPCRCCPGYYVVGAWSDFKGDARAS